LIVVGAIATSIFPFVTRAIAAGEHSRVPHLLQRSVDIMVAVSVPVGVFALLKANALVRLVGGSAFSGGAFALELLSPVVVLVFVAAMFERALIAGHAERRLLALNIAFLAANVAVSILAIPSYGFKAVAAITCATISVWIVVAAASIQRRYSFAFRFRFAALAAVGGTAAALILLLVPGPLVLSGPPALLAYGLIVLLPPGTGRELAGRLIANFDSRRPVPAGEHLAPQ
jgi:O-antigen/teichoic acid export membrane protein